MYDDVFFVKEHLEPYLKGLIFLIDCLKNGRNIHEACNLQTGLNNYLFLAQKTDQLTHKRNQESLVRLLKRAREFCNQEMEHKLSGKRSEQ